MSNCIRFPLALLICLGTYLLAPAQGISFERNYGGSHVDEGSAFAFTPDGGYMVIGNTWSYGAGAADIYLLRLDSNGDTLWTRTYGGEMDDYAVAIHEIPDEGYVIVGMPGQHDPGDFIFIMGIDYNGEIQWVNEDNSLPNWVPNSTLLTAKNQLIIAGGTIPYECGDAFIAQYNLHTHRYDWIRTYGEPDFDEFFNSIKQTRDGGYIAAGRQYFST
jgi:hypothetical protein